MRGKFWTQSNFSRWHGEELGSAMPTRMVGLVFVADDDAMVVVGNIGGAERGAVCAVACCNAVQCGAVGAVGRHRSDPRCS